MLADQKTSLGRIATSWSKEIIWAGLGEILFSSLPVDLVEVSRSLKGTGCLKACFHKHGVELVTLPQYLLWCCGIIRWRELIDESILLFPLSFHPSKEAELITKFLPMLMSFVVDDHTFNVDQKLPSEEKGPIPYPSTIPEAFTKYVICVPNYFLHTALVTKAKHQEANQQWQKKILYMVKTCLGVRFSPG